MAGGKETPRQKMIGMMYLVLTALLALNVSKDILNSFVIVNNGIEVTNKSFDNKNQNLYTDFENAKSINPDKVTPYKLAADKVQNLSQEMNDYIHQIKKDLILAVDGGKTNEEAEAAIDDLMLVEGKDNYDIPTHVMVGDGTMPTCCKAKELRDKLDDYRNSLLGLLKDTTKIGVVNLNETLANLGDLGIDTKTPKPNPDHAEMNSWENSKFYHLPVVATVTMLSKIQNEVKNAEAEIVSTLFNQVDAGDFKFDTLAAKIIAKTNYVVQGDKFEADIFVAAFSTTDNPVVLVGDKYENGQLKGRIDSVFVDKGVGRYSVPASSVGLKKKVGLVKLKDPSGEWKNYPVDIEYIVAKPSLVVSPTKMNVLYIGVDNPIDISVSGFSDDRIKPSISQGTLRKVGAGSYIAKVKKGGKANISVSVSSDEGKARSMGRMEFRVKPVPDPVAKVAGKKGGPIKKNLLAAQQGVIADLENFDFDLKFKVKSFSVSATVKGFDVTHLSKNNRFTKQQKNLIKGLRRGSKLYIDDVKAIGPDGRPRKLSPIIFKIQ